MRKVLVIGNGFDLYHNKKTGYGDFMSFVNDLFLGKYDHKTQVVEDVNTIFKDVCGSYKSSSLLNYFVQQFRFSAFNKKWIDLEHELKIFISQLTDYINEINEEAVQRAIFIKTGHKLNSQNSENSLLLSTSVSIFTLTEGNKIKPKKQYVSLWGKLDLESILSQIEKELSCVSLLLEYYLMNIEPKVREKECVPKDLFKTFDYSAVISFNYTNTVQDLYSTHGAHFYYPHGSLEKHNTVLGYNDDEEDNSNDLIFKKYYRRLVNRTDGFDIKKYNSSSSRDGVFRIVKPTVCFFGHSLDVSDDDLLKDLLKESDRIEVYYLTEEDRSEKISNLIKILNKDEVIKRMNKSKITFLPIDS